MSRCLCWSSVVARYEERELSWRAIRDFGIAAVSEGKRDLPADMSQLSICTMVLKFPMQPRGKDVNRTAIAIIGRMIHELVIQRATDAQRQFKVVVGFQNSFRPVT